MRFLVRWAFRLFILLLVLMVALVLLKDVLAKALLERQIRAQSGMDVKIGALELGLLSPSLTLEDFKLFNPAEFGGSPLLDIPDLHVEYDVGALVQRRLHLRLMRVALKEVNIVEAKSGLTNLVLALNVDPGPAPAQGQTEQLFGLDFTGIDTLNLTVGKIRFTSLRRPENATELKLDLRNQVYTNLKSVADIRNLLLRASFRNGITITTTAPSERRNPSGPPAGVGASSGHRPPRKK